MTEVPPKVELRHLRYFLAVYEELHFGRAAERLFMAQPPLSQAIRKLEAELGVQLFDRTSRVVTPTPAGHAFAAEAASVLTGLEAAITGARRAGAGHEPALRIGCVPNVSLDLVQRFLDALREREPTVEREVTNLLSLELVRQVREGALDFAILHWAEAYDGMEMAELAPGEPMTGVLPLHHRAAGRDVVGPADLGDEVLVTGARTINPVLYDRSLASIAAAGYQFRSIRQAGAVTARDLALAVAEGFGVAFLPSSVDLSDADGTIVVRRPLEPAPTFAKLVVAWRSDAPGRVQDVIQSVREVAKELRLGSAQ
jgi:DNA-binding transcriptional LysR family regulator